MRFLFCYLFVFGLIFVQLDGKCILSCLPKTDAPTCGFKEEPQKDILPHPRFRLNKYLPPVEEEDTCGGKIPTKLNKYDLNPLNIVLKKKDAILNLKKCLCKKGLNCICPEGCNCKREHGVPSQKCLYTGQDISECPKDCLCKRTGNPLPSKCPCTGADICNCPEDCICKRTPLPKKCPCTGADVCNCPDDCICKY